MNLTQFSADDMQRVTDIIRKKEELLRDVAALDHQLAQIGAGGFSSGNGHLVQPAQPAFGQADQSTAWAVVLKALRAAGPAGMTSKELAAATGRNPAAAHALMTYYKKRKPEVRRRGHQWILQEQGPPPPPNGAPASGREATTRNVIVAALQRAGSEGMTLPALVQQTGLSYGQVSNCMRRTVSGRTAPIIRAAVGLYAYRSNP